MNYIDFTQPGGYPLQQETFGFLQEAYSSAFRGISLAFGEDTIISGCIITGPSMSGGWVFVGGELLYFEAGAVSTHFKVAEDITQLTYQNGNTVDAMKIRVCRFDPAGTIPFSSLVRIDSLKSQQIDIQNLIADVNALDYDIDVINTERIFQYLGELDIISLLSIDNVTSFTFTYSSPTPVGNRQNKIWWRKQGDVLQLHGNLKLVTSGSPGSTTTFAELTLPSGLECIQDYQVFATGKVEELGSPPAQMMDILFFIDDDKLRLSWDTPVNTNATIQIYIPLITIQCQ